MIRNLSLKDGLTILLLITVIIIFFYGLGAAFIPLTFAWFLAYATIPLVKKLEKRGLSRLQSSMIVLAMVFVGFLISALLILPPLIADLHAAVVSAPQYLSASLAKMDEILSHYGFHVPYNKETLVDFANQYSQKISGNLLRTAGEFLRNSLINAASVIVIWLNVFLIPIFFVYVINDYEKLIDFIESLVPLSWRPQLDQFIQESNQILSGYIRGQLLVCAILSVLYSLGLLILGLKFAIIIGVMTGFLSIIPYVGFSFGLAGALVMALADFNGVGPLVGVFVVYMLVQVLESFVITPQIVGNSVGLSSFEAIIALIVFGNLLGFIGLFLAIPVGAITKLLLRNLFEQYKSTTFYKTC